MAKMKNARKAFISSLVALTLSGTLMVGSTYAWFTDSVTSGGNIIKTGTLKVAMSYMDGDENPAGTGWKNAQDGAIFESTLWEPGKVEARHLKIENTGSLAFKYKLSILPNGEVSKLADVIEVYFAEGAKQMNGRDVSGLKYVGTLRQMINDMDGAIHGALLPEGTTAGDTYERADEVTATLAFKMREDAGNEYQDMSVGSSFTIQLLATQYTYETDSFDKEYDGASEYPVVSVPVAVPEVSETIKVETEGMQVEIPAALVDILPDEVETVSLAYSEPKVEGETITYDNIDFVDQDGKIIDLEELGNGQTFTVKLPVVSNSFAEGDNAYVYHDGKLVASSTVSGGVISYDVAHFCEVVVERYIKVSTADELVEALGDGYDVQLLNDIEIQANATNGYGATAINVLQGQEIDGNNYTLNVKGANGTWDSGISTTGGVIKNLKVKGSFRGIFVNHNSTYSEKVVLENVVVDGPTYTINCDQGLNQGLEATNCTFNGWTSYATTVGNVKFVNCTFGEGSGYAFMRPYAPTEYVGCAFEEGFSVDARAKVTFDNCTLAGEKLNLDNMSELVGENTANVKMYVEVSTADELVAALENGQNVRFLNDIKIDPAKMSNAYGATGINVTKGQAIDGNGYTLNIAGAGGTWDSGINTTGGLIKNLTVTGSFRGIFINHNSTHSEKVVLENVTTTGTVYTISCDQGLNQGLVATNCTFNGWTSFAATLGNTKFVNCTFGEGSGYAYMRPYAPTEYVGCTFAAGYTVDPVAAVTMENCKLANAVITAENLASLVSNVANVTLK